MIKPVTANFFPQNAPIKNFKQLVQKKIKNTTFLKQDLLTGFTVDEFIKNSKNQNIKCIAPEIFY